MATRMKAMTVCGAEDPMARGGSGVNPPGKQWICIPLVAADDDVEVVDEEEEEETSAAEFLSRGKKYALSDAFCCCVVEADCSMRWRGRGKNRGQRERDDGDESYYMQRLQEWVVNRRLQRRLAENDEADDVDVDVEADLADDGVPRAGG
jgi:hypothetical protein